MKLWEAIQTGQAFKRPNWNTKIRKSETCSLSRTNTFNGPSSEKPYVWDDSHSPFVISQRDFEYDDYELVDRLNFFCTFQNGKPFCFTDKETADKFANNQTRVFEVREVLK